MATGTPATSAVSCSDHLCLIQGINTEKDARKDLYCLTCLLEDANPSETVKTIQTVDKFLESIAPVYSTKKKKIRKCRELPIKKAENINKLAQHIEEEKKRIGIIYDELARSLVETINQIKQKVFAKLDEQTERMCAGFRSYEAELQKVYPESFDMESKYPSLDTLKTRMADAKTLEQLAAYVAILKSNVYEQEKDVTIENMFDALSRFESHPPKIDVKDVSLKKLKTDIQQQFQDNLEFKMFQLKNIWPADLKLYILNGKSTTSRIVSLDQWELINEWLGPEYGGSITPIYKSSIHGLDRKSFISKCDNKDLTLALIKCKYDSSSEPSIIGCFVDKKLIQGSTIYSDKAFIFSVSNAVKCPIIKSKPAVLYYDNEFRYGSDIQIFYGCYNSRSQPGCYFGSSKIIDQKDYDGTSSANFKIIEMEVYQVSNKKLE